jgi:hypothetical protein
MPRQMVGHYFYNKLQKSEVKMNNSKSELKAFSSAVADRLPFYD